MKPTKASNHQLAPSTQSNGQDPVSQLIKIYARIERRRRQQSSPPADETHDAQGAR